jgi:DNA-binding transcriptional regulator YiaG
MAQLHRMLADRFVRQQRMLAPVEIRFLRKHVGLSGTQLAQRMGVTRETVSRWETGAVPMGSVADRLLRLLVVAQEPAESCAVDEMLSGLTDAPAPLKLPSVALWVNGRSGWSAGNARVLSKR